ncbi:hypothetical protein RFI_04039, partial [Reticulomyxa filosa]
MFLFQSLEVGYLLGFCFYVSQSAEEIQFIIHHWIRKLKIKLGWIYDFDKLVVNYVMFYLFLFYLIQQANTFFMFDTFRLSSKLVNKFIGHNDIVYSIDFLGFGDNQFICSGSYDQTIRVWNVETCKQIKSFNQHLGWAYCVKFSPYHYYNHRQNVICSSSSNNTIHFWDFKNNKQLDIFSEHIGWVSGIKFSSFNCGKYLCSGSADKTICLWDVETSKLLH